MADCKTMLMATLTVEDCIRKLEQEGMAAIIENGTVTGFVKENSPCQSR